MSMVQQLRECYDVRMLKTEPSAFCILNLSGEISGWCCILYWNLGGTGVGDQATQDIASCLRGPCSLTSLGLESEYYFADCFKCWRQNVGSSVTSMGVKFIADALKQNNSVTNIYLDRNQIGDDGAKCIADTLKHNKTIKTVHLISESLSLNL